MARIVFVVGILMLLAGMALGAYGWHANKDAMILMGALLCAGGIGIILGELYAIVSELRMEIRRLRER